MFDIGFWELAIIALVALIIIGPKRLPEFARDTGRVVGKIRNFIQSAKRELEKELELDQLNDLNESINHVDNLLKQAPDRIIKDQVKDITKDDPAK
jgi:sec-independent protein translocase protein TatB